MVLTMIHHIWPLSTIVNTNWHCEKGPEPRDRSPSTAERYHPRRVSMAATCRDSAKWVFHGSRSGGILWMDPWINMVDISGNSWIYGRYIWDFMDLWWIYLGIHGFMVDISGNSWIYGGYIWEFMDLWWIYLGIHGFMVDISGNSWIYGRYIWEFMDLWWIYLGTIAVENGWVGIKWNETSSWVVNFW